MRAQSGIYGWTAFLFETQDLSPKVCLCLCICVKMCLCVYV